MDNVKMISLADIDKSEFINLLRQELYKKFNATADDMLPENYSNTTDWSLIKMIENSTLDTYQLLFVDNEFWGSSGGMIREFNGEKIYQAGFRAVSKSHDITYKGLGTKPYMNAFCTRYQIDRAKETGCRKVILSFNEHNTKLFELVHKFHNTRPFMGVKELMKDFKPSETPVLFNGVPQWLLTMELP